MLYGRFAANPKWMNDMGVIDAETKEEIDATCAKILRLQQLVFSRWSQVMYRFEKSMYANPDQDLNKLWWDLVEEYQMVKRPDGRDKPDWATKIHIASSPCYYHNYHLGELLASQLYYHIKDEVLMVREDAEVSFYEKPVVGEYLITNVFEPAARWQWNDMIERATGEKLTPKYYAKQFVK
jgi:peptidyl-dipeptidase A